MGGLLGCRGATDTASRHAHNTHPTYTPPHATASTPHQHPNHQAGAIDPETDALLRENGVDHGEHAHHLLHDSLRDVPGLGPAILPPPISISAGGEKRPSPSPSPSPCPTPASMAAEDEARLRRLGQEWTIPEDEIAKRCANYCCVRLGSYS